MHLPDIITREASSFSLASSVAQIQATVLRTKNLMFRIRAFSAGVLLAIALNAHATTILQSPNSQFIAWEGEDVYSITNNPGSPDSFVVTNDATASGSRALYQTGANQTAPPPYSAALFALKFSTPGTYTLYFRWRGLKERTDQDVTGANSFFIPNDFGDIDLNGNSQVSGVNNSRVPPDVNNYAMYQETLQTYTVTQAQVDAGQPLIFKIGGREWGMFVDRFAFSLRTDLTEASFNALPNSGASSPPTIQKAVGSATLTTVTVTFDKPLQGSSISASDFTISGGLGVSSATLDTTTPKDVVLTTAPQTPGTSYTITVNGVADVSGNAIVTNSTVSFTAWKLASGWVTRQLYYSIPGGAVTDLQNSPKFPNTPDAVDFLRTVGFDNKPAALNYGTRLTAYFVPPQDGQYEFLHVQR